LVPGKCTFANLSNAVWNNHTGQLVAIKCIVANLSNAVGNNNTG
jgi:hypothetical protein